jgi:CheY-like chemotaxis protein
MAAAERPDLVLMDLTLPGIDGCEATRRIKVTPETSGIPVIAFSGHAEEDKGALARAAGCADYARKPIQIRVLLGKVQALLAAAEAPASASADGVVSR